MDSPVPRFSRGRLALHAARPTGETKKTFVPKGPIPMVPLGQKSETSVVPPKLMITRPLSDVPSHVFPW